METREVFYDVEAELPSGLWQLGQRTVKLRAHCRVTGTVDERHPERFIVARIEKLLRWEVEPEGWTPPPTPRDGILRA